MTTPAEVPDAVLEALKDAVGTTTKTDEQLRALLAATYDVENDEYDINGVAANLWEAKAVSYAALVDVSESGSSRKMSDLHKNAIGMVAYFRGKSTVVVADVSNRPRTRAIRRPEAS